MKSLRDLLWILPFSLVLGLVLSLLGPGTWWIGWLAYSFLFILGLLALSALWRSAGSPRALGWMLVVSLALRLGVGIFFSYVLPIYGYDTEVHRAGYIYRDASTYDTQAWELASSSDPLWKAFDHSYGIEEQYGGLTFTLSLTYRLLSPDAHRAWLTILLSALVGALGVALAWKGAKQSWGESVALFMGWIMALYPESLLVGASQVREPFLILFTAMALWGAVDWWANHHRTAWIWLVGSVVGMLLFSPGVAVAALFVLGIWAWLRGKERRINWWWVVGATVVILLGTVFLGVLVGGTLQAPAGPLANLVNWLRYSMNFGAYFTTLNSGMIQAIFSTLPEPLHLPFIVTYGIVQPVLPAAVADPAVWPTRFIGILRGLGWYALLPFLLYALRSIWKVTEKRERLAWLWLWLTSWIWIILSSARGGGDQWDNPRYRVILLLFQAALAAQALACQRANRDLWLGRILGMEGVFLTLFGYWYFLRKTNAPNQLDFSLIIVLTIMFSIFIFVGGRLWDLKVKKKIEDGKLKR